MTFAKQTGDVENRIWDTLTEFSGEDVLRAFTYCYGTQLLNDSFWDFLQSEGYAPEDEDTEDANC